MSSGDPNSDLPGRLKSLRQKRQELAKLLSAEREATPSIVVQPAPRPPPPASHDHPQHLAIHHPRDVVQLHPAGTYHRSIQTDSPPPAAAPARSAAVVNLEIDELSKSYFEPSIENRTSDEEPDITSDWVSATFEHPYPTDLHWSPSSHVAVAYRPRQQAQNGAIRVFDAQRPDRPHVIDVVGHPSAVRWVPRSSDKLLIGTAVGDLFLFDRRAGLIAQTLRKGSCHSSQIVSLLFPASTKLLSLASDSTVMLWNVDALPAPLAKAKLQISPATVACLDDSGGLIIGFEEGTIARRSAELRKDEKSRPVVMDILTAGAPERGMVTTLAYRPSSYGGKGTLAVGTIDGAISLWSGEKCYQRIESLVDGVLACCWQPSSVPKLAICRSGGSPVVIYDVEANMEMALNLAPHNGAGDVCPISCDFSLDGSILGVGDNQGRLHLLRCERL
jgi:WD40 repeat protein